MRNSLEILDGLAGQNESRTSGFLDKLGLEVTFCNQVADMPARHANDGGGLSGRDWILYFHGQFLHEELYPRGERSANKII
jgi:hypothetical protein